MTLAVGAYFGGTSAARFGYQLAFVYQLTVVFLLRILHRPSAFSEAISEPDGSAA